VFISYARHDRAYVVQLAEHLEAERIRVWFDYELAAGEHFDEEIKHQIVTSAAMIVVLTPAAVTSRWVAREIACADEARVPLVPLLLAVCSTPLRLQGLHSENVTAGGMPSRAAIEELRRRSRSAAPNIEHSPVAPGPSRDDDPPDVIGATSAPAESATPSGAAFLGLIRSLAGHTRQIRALAFSPDGSVLASGSRDRSIRIWDTTTWALRREIRNEAEASWPLAFMPGSSILAAGTYGSGGVDLIDVDTGATVGHLADEHDDIHSIAFSADGQLLATGGHDRTARLWDVATGASRGRLSAGRAVPGWPLAFAPKGSKIVVAHFGGPTAGIWDTTTLRMFRGLARHTDYVTAVAYAPDGNTVATGSDDTTVRLWGSESGALRRTLRGHTRGIHSVAFSPDSRLLVSGSTDRKIRIWSTASGEIVATLRAPVGGIYALAFSADAQFLASGGGDKHVRIWAVGGPAEEN